MRFGWHIGFAAIVLGSGFAVTQQSAYAQQKPEWVCTWAASPSQLPDVVAQAPPFQTLFHPEPVQTIRNIVHVSIGGDTVRVRATNAFGKDALDIVAAHVAVRQSKDAIVPGTDQRITFGGSPSMVVPPGADALSDPVSLRVAPHSDLAVTFVIKGRSGTSTVHALALQTSFTAPGDQVGAVSLTKPSEITSWPFLSEVDVIASPEVSAVVALGDSLTDGAATHVDENRRWPDILSDRLTQAGFKVGVANSGIAGNRILHDGEGPYAAAFGANGLARLDRDVFSVAGIKYVIVALGINDIGQPGSGGVSASSEVTLEQIRQGMLQIVARTHTRGIRVMGATLTPFGLAKAPGYYSADKEKRREALNEWIRNSGAFDAVADFDLAVRDPNHPQQLMSDFNGGDGLHPNASGMKAMADSISLSFFR